MPRKKKSKSSRRNKAAHKRGKAKTAKRAARTSRRTHRKKTAARKKRHHSRKIHDVYISCGPISVDPDPVEIYPDDEIHWHGSGNWTVHFPTTPFNDHHFHPGHSNSGNPHKKGTFKYTVTCEDGESLDPQVIVH
jgi:hypothetical protein